MLSLKQQERREGNEFKCRVIYKLDSEKRQEFLSCACFIHQAGAGPEKVGQKNICNLAVQGTSPMSCA